VKNHEPTKHSALTAPAPAIVAHPGAVAIAKSDAPPANSQHWRGSITMLWPRID
jgi:hypothetical protein